MHARSCKRIGIQKILLIAYSRRKVY
jgi:hypothetical protein